MKRLRYKRWRSTAWSLRHPDRRDNQYVSVEADGSLHLAVRDHAEGWVHDIYLPRADARLLARRINQALAKTQRP